jgi:type IV fimbrial biogenesis protein FimT
MAVVMIIGILAVIAVPGAANRFRENRSQRAANEIATLYRNARMRAMGRGAAVLVRWNTTNDTFQVFEAIQGTGAFAAANAACASQPAAQCRAPGTRWQAGATTNQLLGTFSARTLGELTTTVSVAGAEVNELDICFSPMGSSYVVNSNVTTDATLLQPMGTVPVVRVSRDSGVGLTRQVLFLPNGTSRVVAEDPDL